MLTNVSRSYSLLYTLDPNYIVMLALRQGANKQLDSVYWVMVLSLPDTV